MTNLEYLVSKEKINVGNCLCMASYQCKYDSSCKDVKCGKCEFVNDIELCVQTLLEEHKEPIKLTQWEKDMIEIRNENDINFDNPLYCNEYFHALKNKGYFKNIDLSKTAKEILENCEVVENVD